MYKYRESVEKTLSSFLPVEGKKEKFSYTLYKNSLFFLLETMIRSS